MQTLFQRPDQLHEKLFVLTCIFNPIRYRTRWRHAQDFVRMVEAVPNVELYVAEVAFGERDFVMTEPGNPKHLQLVTSHELWLKENSLNLLMARLPLEAKKIAWVDADTTFVRQDWANETLHQLEHYPVVQMWSEAHDLNPDHEIIQTHKSFAYCHAHHYPLEASKCGYYEVGDKQKFYRHPGFAWAARRDVLSAIGRLLEVCAIGSADFHMAYSLIGEVERTILPGYSARYKEKLIRWGQIADSVIKRKIGYVPGTLLHYFHGPKAHRRYKDRYKILTDTKYNPDVDLLQDWQGLYQLTDNNLELRDRIMAYFRGRSEDASPCEPSPWADTMMKRRELED